LSDKSQEPEATSQEIEDTTLEELGVEEEDIEIDDFLKEEQRVYSKLATSQTRLIAMWGEIDSESSRMYVESLIGMAMQDPCAPIEIWVNSPGGNLIDALAIYDVMRYIPCPVYTVGIGMVMSAAVMLVAAGTDGCRSSLPNTRFMMHQVRYGGAGSTTDMATIQEEAISMQKIYTNILAEHSKIPVGTIGKILASNKDHYLIPEQAVKYGFIDYVREYTNKEITTDAEEEEDD